MCLYVCFYLCLITPEMKSCCFSIALLTDCKTDTDAVTSVLPQALYPLTPDLCLASVSLTPDLCLTSGSLPSNLLTADL